ncbi:hypothetical protein RZN05_17195 [Sphingomonas sp. HF-S4]|uniref:Uncharacterized protein n=1 Tax=Sphingomonas agrestis TaxID=3080540 RepID=A0ABU3YBF9_9SPHN|nr:hypothetical protein [Sphingomonas sp. HF-S4]MDV3458736.1 hypothetical protein [Sphingomonas sp. HF-S4]
MSDSSGGVGGVGGAGSSSGASGANASDASTGPSAQGVADSLTDAATSPAGVDTEALGAAVAGIQAADPAFGAEVAAAVEAQLSAVDAARFEGALDVAAAQTSLAHQVATPVDVPATPTVTSVNPTYSFNLQGQLIDACGTPVATAQAPDPHQAALEKSLAEYDEHAQKVTGGPVSGPAYSAAYALGADKQTLDNVHNVGKMMDGAVEHWAQKAEEMHVPGK